MGTLEFMDRKTRSEYGARLLAARNYKDMTQTALAKEVGMSQSAYGQAETTGSGSSFTSQLAAVCGVRAHWLATGEGKMLEGGPSDAPDERERLSNALDELAAALRGVDKNTRIAIAPLLSSMAEDPDDAKNKSSLILKLLVTDYDKVQPTPHDRRGQAHISAQLGPLGIGVEDGRSNTDAAASPRKE